MLRGEGYDLSLRLPFPITPPKRAHLRSLRRSAVKRKEQTSLKRLRSLSTRIKFMVLEVSSIYLSSNEISRECCRPSSPLSSPSSSTYSTRTSPPSPISKWTSQDRPTLWWKKRNERYFTYCSMLWSAHPMKSTKLTNISTTWRLSNNV